MARSKRVRREMSKLSKSGALGMAGLVLLLGCGLSWAGPPNPTSSDINNNTAGGTNALSFNATGAYNTAFGSEALEFSTSGGLNTATGSLALRNNGTGSGNTASGFAALYSNNGDYNTATGYLVLQNNSTGSGNTASGFQALQGNTTGSGNTASGVDALLSNTTGGNNSASGNSALYSNTTGIENAAFGYEALVGNTAGIDNTAVGNLAGSGNTTGTANTFIGSLASANGDYINGTALGHGALLTASNSIVLGNTSVSAILAQVSSITAISDRRRKKEIRALDADLGLDFIQKLQPVSYRFNNGDETERYGFIAQDLEEALPTALHDMVETSEPEHGLALIERQNDNDHTYRVSYGELTAPIVKAIQQLQQEIEAERQQNADLRHALREQAAAFKAENDALRHSIAALREQVTAAR